MKFVIEIKCDNAAFEGEPLDEVQRILREQSAKILNWIGDGSTDWDDNLFDLNGNKVGFARLVKDDR